MDKEWLDYITEKTHDLINAASCCDEAKAAAQAWLAAVNTKQEVAETQKYIAELKADIMPVGMLVDFAESDKGIQLFGVDTAKNIAAHGRQIQSAGAKYCDCPACTAAAAILSKTNTPF
ncbi:molecular chaperone Hsp90 [Pectinatus sottacetonis]|uniref:molecular chaperone Hsp90 n=1 Tax=Pectinatus sottacetonis TaxID=1002795 RepID=UPI0018C6ED5B|nr:molecular chaperone Hsp90 [Pectinatus sottacetonis]